MILRTDSTVKQKTHKNHDFHGFSVAEGLHDLLWVEQKTDLSLG